MKKSFDDLFDEVAYIVGNFKATNLLKKIDVSIETEDDPDVLFNWKDKVHAPRIIQLDVEGKSLPISYFHNRICNLGPEYGLDVVDLRHVYPSNLYAYSSYKLHEGCIRDMHPSKAE